MTVWLGSYLLKTVKPLLKVEESFIVWTKNKKEAAQFVDDKMGNVDKETSLFEVAEIGIVNFSVSSRRGLVIFTPPKEDLKNNERINLRICATDSELVWLKVPH